MLPQSDVPLLYRGHAAFLFTSRYEAWGLPVMEAMASGLPVVATRCLGVAAFAEHGFNCLLADAQAWHKPFHIRHHNHYQDADRSFIRDFSPDDMAESLILWKLICPLAHACLLKGSWTCTFHQRPLLTDDIFM